MPKKRLVICCDGTWNSPDQGPANQPTPTNVTKLALTVAPVDSSGAEQRMFYHRGVGTKRSERIRGGAFGLGLSRDVRDCYRFVVANFEPGDEIFLFGFSRGAFTARSTAGFIRNSGILRPEESDRVDEAYALYRSRDAHPRGTQAQLFRRSYSTETRIRFIGVWDTVGALGIPLNGLRLVAFWNRRYRFHDTDLSTKVDAACQALAIDERRGPFRPAVWSKQADAGDQILEQVWFSGVHCDVGGGYKEHGLSDIALMWLVRKAVENGLAVDEVALAAGPFVGQPNVDPCASVPDALAMPPHNSRTMFYRLIPAYDRPVEQDPAKAESASSSAVRRLNEIADYRPANLRAYLQGDHGITDVGPC